jgi:hypothetical protein
LVVEHVDLPEGNPVGDMISDAMASGPEAILAARARPLPQDLPPEIRASFEGQWLEFFREYFRLVKGVTDPVKCEQLSRRALHSKMPSPDTYNLLLEVDPALRTLPREQWEAIVATPIEQWVTGEAATLEEVDEYVEWVGETIDNHIAILTAPPPEAPRLTRRVTIAAADAATAHRNRVLPTSSFGARSPDGDGDGNSDPAWCGASLVAARLVDHLRASVPSEAVRSQRLRIDQAIAELRVEKLALETDIDSGIYDRARSLRLDALVLADEALLTAIGRAKP